MSRNQKNRKQEKSIQNEVLLEDEVEEDDEDDFFVSEKPKKRKANEEIQETADEKRVRLAEKYLNQMKNQKDEEEDEEENEKGEDSLIAKRLRTQWLKDHGKIAQREVKFKEGIITYIGKKEGEVKSYKPGHQKTVTSVVISSDDRFIYSCSHDYTIFQYEISTGKKKKILIPPTKTKRPQFYCVSLSYDNEYLAASGSERLIHVWKTSDLSLYYTFNSGHRAPINTITFQQGSHQLYSASSDRTVKIFSIDEKAYIDTLFGHQSEVMDIDTFQKERAVSSGTDVSAHVWKITEESQLIFKGNHQSSLDCIKVLNENIFIGASQDGGVSVWSTQKKNPLCKIEQCHGIDEASGCPNWISSLATVRSSNLFATGSCNGEIKIWKLDLNQNNICHIATIPEMKGWVNSLAFSKSSHYLIAGLGREHRFGRWDTKYGSQNRVVIIKLP